jgi:hypothetical protein
MTVAAAGTGSTTIWSDAKKTMDGVYQGGVDQLVK